MVETNLAIKKLQEKGVISGFTILKSYKKLGYPLRSVVLVKLKNLTEENLKEVKFNWKNINYLCN